MTRLNIVGKCFVVSDLEQSGVRLYPITKVNEKRACLHCGSFGLLSRAFAMFILTASASSQQFHPLQKIKSNEFAFC
jgi:hypothetical protein